MTQQQHETARPVEPDNAHQTTPPAPHDDESLPPHLREALRIMAERGPVVELTAPKPVATPLDPTVQATHYVVSCLPEGHEERHAYAIQVGYRGHDRWVVELRGQQLGADGTWSWGFQWDPELVEPVTEEEMDDYDRRQTAWLAAHRFDFDTAMFMAKVAATKLTYRGRSVADALADAGSAV